MKNWGLIYELIKGSVRVAHSTPDLANKNVKKAIFDSLTELKEMDSAKRVNSRIKKFASMGHYEEA